MDEAIRNALGLFVFVSLVGVSAAGALLVVVGLKAIYRELK